MIKTTLRVLPFLLLAAPGMLAQGEPPQAGSGEPAGAVQEKAASDAELLIKAVGALQEKGAFVLSGQVKQNKPASIADDLPMERSIPFDGSFEVFRPKQGETLIASVRQLPGFVLYDAGNRHITQRTTEDGSVSIGQLARDVHAMLDLQKLSLVLKRAEKLESASDEATGTTTHRATLTSGFIPETGQDAGRGMMAMMTPKILKVRGTWKVGRDGQLQELGYEVLRNDPMAAMAEMVSGMMGAGGGGREEAGDMLAGFMNNDKAGATATYTLTVKAGEAAKNTMEALKTMRGLVGR